MDPAQSSVTPNRAHSAYQRSHEPQGLQPRGLSLARRTCRLRDVRLHDRSPAENTNMLSSDDVGMASAATRRTAKDRLTWTIGLVDMPARWTGARGVPGIDQHDWDTGALRFVGHKRQELKERPAMQNGALRLPSPHPRANVLEVFKRYSSLRALSLPNDALADRMVHILGKAGLLPGQAPEPSCCGACAFLLQPIPKPPMPIAHVLDRAAAVDGAVRVRSDIRHTQVNAEHLIHSKRLRLLKVTHGEQIPFATDQDQIGFAVAGLKQWALPRTADERDRLPPVQGPDRHRRVRQGKRQDAVIVGNRRVGPEGARGALVRFVGVSNLCQCPNGHLGRESKLLTYLRVAQPLQGKLAKGARLPGNGAEVVTRRIGRLKRALEHGGLWQRRLQFQLSNEFHVVKYSPYIRLPQPDSSRSRRPEAWCESSLRRAVHSSARAKARRHPERIKR